MPGLCGAARAVCDKGTAENRVAIVRPSAGRWSVADRKRSGTDRRAPVTGRLQSGVGRSLTKWSSEDVRERSGKRQTNPYLVRILSTVRDPNANRANLQSHGMETKQIKLQRITVRMTAKQIADLRKQAAHAGSSVSELVRDRSLLKPVVSRTDKDTAKSIDQLGRLLKLLYPKDKGWATTEDRRKWWKLVEDLQRTAAQLRRTP